MSTTALRQRPQWLVLGTVALAAAIGGTLRMMSVQNSTAPSRESQSTEQRTNSSEAAALLEAPMVSVSEELRKAVAPSELVGSTSREERLSEIAAGRVDPFAPVIQQTEKVVPDQEEPIINTDVPVIEPISPSSVPVAPVSSASDLPPVPVSVPAPQIPTLPSIPVASDPVAIPAWPNALPQTNSAPQDPIQAVELSGVIQIGDRVGVIVREGRGKASHHAFEGDLLAGGQIRIKSIDLSSHEPLIILEYQGKEYPRIVG